MHVVRTIAVLGLLVGMPASVWATDVAVVLRRMTAAFEPALDVSARVEFVVEDGRGEEVRWTGRYERLGTPPLRRVALETPDALAGVSVVLEGGPTKRRRARIRLPFAGRTLEVPRKLQGASFMGSDFTLDDFGFLQPDLRQYTVRGEEKVDGRPCLRVDEVPARSWWYRRISYCLDLEDWLPRRTEYFDRAGKLIKVRTMAVEWADGTRTPVRVTMEVPSTKTKTTMVLTKVDYNVGLTPAMLEPDAPVKPRLQIRFPKAGASPAR